MRRPWSRRAFLGLVATTVLGAIVATRAWFVVGARPAPVLVAVLRRRLDYLRLEPDGLARFAADYLEQLSPATRRRLSWLAAVSPLYPAWLSPVTPVFGPRLAHFEAELVSAFLLSSDFFHFGADENRLVRYVTYYDPYAACGNPFFRARAGSS
jgi:hypothetical protein